jgi:Short C-terminal domain
MSPFLMRPGRRIARAAVGAAVIGGTAAVVNNKMNQHYANQANAQAQQQQMADMQYQQQQLAAQQQQLAAQQQAALPQQAPAPALPAANPMDEQIAQIQKFAKLKDQGILTEDEFQAKKKQILGI